MNYGKFSTNVLLFRIRHMKTHDYFTYKYEQFKAIHPTETNFFLYFTLKSCNRTDIFSI